MEQDILLKFEEQSKKLDRIEHSVHKIRSYLFWTAVVSLAFFVLPFIGLLFVIPRFIDVYTSVRL